MSIFANTDLGRVPDTGGSVRLTISSNVAHQTASTPCKIAWIKPSANTVRLNFGSVCAADTGISLPYGDAASPFKIGTDDINRLYFFGSGGSETIDILYTC